MGYLSVEHGTFASSRETNIFTAECLQNNRLDLLQILCTTFPKVSILEKEGERNTIKDNNNNNSNITAIPFEKNAQVLYQHFEMREWNEKKRSEKILYSCVFPLKKKSN